MSNAAGVKVTLSPWWVWFLAVRPKTLTASLVPVLVGAALAASQMTIAWDPILFALLTALSIQIGTNLINDAIDCRKGADTVGRLGPMRVAASGLLTEQQVMAGGIMALLLAVLFGLPLMIQGGWVIALLLMLAVACAYCYTGGPYPIAYNGLGELFVFVFFGLASTGGVYYLLTERLDWIVFLAATQVGLMSVLVIAMNNFRDREEDLKNNKNTMAVIFGETFARCQVSFLALMPFCLNFWWADLRYEPAAWLPFLALPIAAYLVWNIWVVPLGIIYNKFFVLSAFLHLCFGLLLTIGLWLS